MRRELANRSDMPERGDVSPATRPVRIAKRAPLPIVIWRSRRKVGGKTPEDRLRRRLERICDAWADFQASRARDAVYGYLQAVFAIVEHSKVRRKRGKLLQSVFEFADLPIDSNRDLFTAVIRGTSDDAVDKKTISKWARALRYVAHCKPPKMRVEAFMKRVGGINASADLYARYFGRRTR